MFETLFRRHREVLGRQAEEGFDGFTLIELLIVIVVLAILAATVIFALGGVTSSSAQASCDSDAKSVEVAVTAFKNFPGNGDNWPAASSDGVASGAPAGAPTLPVTDAPLTGGANPYLRTYPNGNNTHYVIASDADGTVWVYNVKTAAWANYDSTTDPCGTVQ